MFAEAHKPLPLATRLVLTANQVLGAAWPFLAVLGIVLITIGRRSLRRQTTRVRWHGVLLKVPVLGALWRNADAARLARTMAALLQSGVGIPVALGLALQVVTNAAMQQGGLVALGLIRQGATVSAAMLRVAILPDVSVQLLAVGEETGRLDHILLKQADLLEQASSRRVETLLALLVPALTIAIGLMVGSVMAAVMVAVLQLNDIVG
jgi:general secretion pathway protein F